MYICVRDEKGVEGGGEEARVLAVDAEVYFRKILGLNLCTQNAKHTDAEFHSSDGYNN